MNSPIDISTLSKCFMETVMLMHNRLFRNVPVPIPVNQFCALIALMNEGAMGVSELSQVLLISKQQMSSILERLAEAGYVKKAQDKKDRRRTIVSLTKSGQALLDDHSSKIRKRFESRLEELSPEELSSIRIEILRFHDSIDKLFS